MRRVGGVEREKEGERGNRKREMIRNTSKRERERERKRVTEEEKMTNLYQY